MKLTKELLAQARVITKGKRILDVQRLLAQYGGQRARWVSPLFEDSERLYDHYWYEHDGRDNLKSNNCFIFPNLLAIKNKGQT